MQEDETSITSTPTMFIANEERYSDFLAQISSSVPGISSIDHRMGDADHLRQSTIRKPQLPMSGLSASIPLGETQNSNSNPSLTFAPEKAKGFQGNSLENLQTFLESINPFHDSPTQGSHESAMRQIQQDLWQRYRQESNSSSQGLASASVAPALLQSDPIASIGAVKCSNSTQDSVWSKLDSRFAQEHFLHPNDDCLNTHSNSNDGQSAKVEMAQRENDTVQHDWSTMDANCLDALYSYTMDNHGKQPLSANSSGSHQQFISSVFDQLSTPFTSTLAAQPQLPSQEFVSDLLPISFSNEEHIPLETLNSSSSNTDRDNMSIMALPLLPQKGKSRARRRSEGDPERGRLMAKSVKRESESCDSNQDMADNEAEKKIMASNEDNLDATNALPAFKIRKVLLPTRSASETDDVRMTIRHICPHKDCSKDFSTSGHARRHNRIHDTFRQFGCPHLDCIALFTRRDNCKQHQKNSHDQILDAITFDNEEG